MRVPDNKDADADHKNPNPTQRGHSLSKQKISQQGHYGIGKRRRRLNVTVVRPRENEHVRNKEGQEARNPKPNVSGTNDADKNAKNISQRPVFGRAHILHSPAEQHIPQRSKQDDKQDGNVRFQVQARGIFHTVFYFAFFLKFILQDV